MKASNIEIVRELIERGVDINAKDKDKLGVTDNIEFNEKLLKSGIDVNAKTNKKRRRWTALLKASQNGHIEVVKELINRGADINAANNDKRRKDKDIQHSLS